MDWFTVEYPYRIVTNQTRPHFPVIGSPTSCTLYWVTCTWQYIIKSFRKTYQGGYAELLLSNGYHVHVYQSLATKNRSALLLGTKLFPGFFVSGIFYIARRWGWRGEGVGSVRWQLRKKSCYADFWFFRNVILRFNFIGWVFYRFRVIINVGEQA